MNSNYEWQKHQANERVRQYHKEAASHRRAQEGNGRSHSATLLKLALLATIFLAVWIMSGCSSEPAAALNSASSESAEVVSGPNSPTWQMADRIVFQDKREVYLNESVSQGQSGLTMADRIQFQDKRDLHLADQSVTGLTLAERILFQDRVGGNGR